VLEIRHPLTGAVYGLDPDSRLVKVEEGGVAGWFDASGRWVAGTWLDVDPQLCNWIGGPGGEGGYGQSFKSV
jgi:hypothetical protein